MPAENQGSAVRGLTLSDFPFLSSLAASANPSDRRIWLRVACDHFAAGGAADPDTLEPFIDAVIGQIGKADPPTVLEAARTLAPCPLTPLRLLGALRAASPEAGDLALAQGAAYGEQDLLDALGSDTRAARAVASRRDLSARLIHALIGNDEPEALVALAGNPGARLEGAPYAALVARALKFADELKDRRVADALLKRRPLRPESGALFLLAGPLQRVEILLAAQRAQLGRPHVSIAPASSEIVGELELAAVARHPERFVAVLANALACEAGLAARIADDPTGEPLAVALAALGAPNDVLVRVLIANDLQAGENYQRIRALARLNNALDRNAALSVMTALRGEPFPRARRSPSAETAGAAREPASRKPNRSVANPPQRKAAG